MRPLGAAERRGNELRPVFAVWPSTPTRLVCEDEPGENDVRYRTILASLALITGCGGSESPDRADDGADGGGITAPGTVGQDDGSGGGEGNGQEGNGEGNDGEGDGTAADADGDAGPDDGDGDGGGVGPKFDVGSPDGGASCGGGDGGGGDATFSFIWIANSSQSTLTKLNTETLIEEGRYYTRDDNAGSPSRTSVSLSGDAAVANRNGGVGKFFARVEDCVESNGTAGIQTSTGAADIKAWAEEECRAWYTPLVYSSNRPLAWAPGDFNTSTCEWENEKLWTAGASGSGTAEVLLLDGETGVVEQTIQMPEITSGIGLYGGAVDGDGNFWASTNGGQFVRVDRQAFTYEMWPIGPGPTYGIAVDSKGRPWLCGGGHAQRFDPVTETWAATPGASSGIGGCMTDGQGTLYHSRGAEMVGIDTEMVVEVSAHPIPNYVHGVSIDFNGYVWGVAFGSTDAYRLDVNTGTVDTYPSLVGAYTYSDMTGFGLSSAGVPSG